MKIYKSLFEYVDNPLYKSVNALEAGDNALELHLRPNTCAKHQLLGHYHLNIVANGDSATRLVAFEPGPPSL